MVLSSSSVLPPLISRLVCSVIVALFIFNQNLDCSMTAEDQNTHHQSDPRLHKRSPPIFVPLNQVHFPQQQPARHYSSNVWSSQSISAPVNIPNLLTQEDTSLLEQYMKNDYKDQDGNTLNLAALNHRTNKPVARKMAEPSPPSAAKQQAAGYQRQPIHENPTQRVDLEFGYPANPHDNLLEGRKVKVDSDVAIAKQPNRIGHNSHVPSIGNVKQNLVQSILHPAMKLNKFQENCITRSAQQAGMCEDHLIKRLTQDATEGRTVVDVGRRVCCALFWHKECIDSIVLKACPDSTPVAADYILGARKIDLATSCQRYNREGCNGGSKIFPVLSNVLPVVMSIFIMLICL